MSRSARIAAVVGTVLVLVVAFAALRPSDDDTPSSSTSTTPATPGPVATGTTTAPATSAPKYTTIVVRDGKPVGGIKKITIGKGDQARIEVTSHDTSDEIHLHGYDLHRQLEAPGTVRFAFDADADGIYEIELESAGVQIGELVVEPS